ncbi:MAG: rRNA maturation RNase YbeY [Chlorobi bacterium]|nr:rRNA maturation RNase YbeY [Chlorobiota bacterium]
MKFNIETYNSSSTLRIAIKKVKEALIRTFEGESIEQADVNVIYVDDAKIHEINKEYLNHDRTTDVITFSLKDNEEKDSIIDGEIYVSADTARRQASEYKVSFTDEILRLAVHGGLHLCGYEDDNNKKRAYMHKLETKYIR